MITSIAAHEAGHAVLASLSGYDVKEMKCSSSSGYVQAGAFRAPSDASSLTKLRLHLTADALMALGGPCAESEHTHEPTRLILERCGDDRRQAHKAAVGLALTLPEWDPHLHLQIFDGLMKEARRMVCGNWGTIRFLGEKLSLNGSLIGADVLRVIELAERKAA